MGRLDGKSVIVTGAGAGIGRGIARCFAKEGARLTLAELDEETGPAVAKEAQALGADAQFVPCDVGRKEQVVATIDAAVQRFGTVHVVVNNAWGGGGLARVEWQSDDEMRRSFEVGTMGAFWFMQECFPRMRDQGYGRFVNLCSLNGVNAHMYSVNYNMAKEALRAITRTAAREWAGKGITANVICPAAETEASTALRKVMPEMFEALDAAHPMGHLGDPETEIAPVALFLSTEESSYLTGNTLFVDGGSHINGSPWAPELPEEKP